MTTTAPAYETVWNGTLETAAAQAQQRPAPAPGQRVPAGYYTETVLLFLSAERVMGVTSREIAEATGLTRHAVHAAIHHLIDRGAVVRLAPRGRSSDGHYHAGRYAAAPSRGGQTSCSAA